MNNIIEYLPLVGRIAGRIKRRLPAQHDIDDLISEGVIGLIDALDKFDPSRGVTIDTYAGIRIKGAIQDYIRAEDFIKRRGRENAKKANQPAGVLLPLKELSSSLLDPAPSPLAKAIASQAREHMLALIDLLPTRERAVLLYSFYEQLDLIEIAGLIGIGGVQLKSHVCQIRRRALKKLRGLLEDQSQLDGVLAELGT